MTERRQPSFAEKNGYQWQPGRAYLLLGGEAKDILTNCTQCGAPYYGPCQQACLNCETTRKVFYADATNVTLIKNVEESNISSFILPNRDIAQIGDNSHLREIIAAKIELGQHISADLVVGKNIKSDLSGQFGTVIVADNGIADFGTTTKIGKLVVGKDAAIRFGYRNEVNQLLTFGNFTQVTGQRFWNQNRRYTNYKEVTQIIAFYLNS